MEIKCENESFVKLIQKPVNTEANENTNSNLFQNLSKLIKAQIFDIFDINMTCTFIYGIFFIDVNTLKRIFMLCSCLWFT